MVSGTSNATLRNNEALMEVDMSLKEDERDRAIKAKMKRYFFALASKVKKLLGARHQGSYVNTSLMFNYVVKKEVKPEDWPKFLMEEMSQHPEKWRDENKMQKLNAIMQRKKSKENNGVGSMNPRLSMPPTIKPK